METFLHIFRFLWDLLQSVSVSIDSYNFSLKGAIVFAVIIIEFIAFIKWLFSLGE